MPSLKNLSIRHKLLVPILIFVTFIFIFAQGFHFFVNYQNEQKNLIDRVSILAKGVAFNLQAAVLFDDSLAASEVLSAFNADPAILRVKLFDLNEQLFSIYEAQADEAPIPDQAQRDALQKKGHLVAGKYLYLLVPIEMDGSKIASLRITVSNQAFEQIINKLIESSIVFFFMLLPTGALLYLIVQKFILEPVYSLHDSMQAFVEHRLKRPNLKPKADDEIGALIDAFNTMVKRLAQRDSQVHYTLDRLEKEKAFANEVIETVQHALLVVNHDGVILHSNAASKEIFPISLAAVENNTLTDLIQTEEKEVLIAAIEQKRVLDDYLLSCKKADQSVQLLQISSRSLSNRGATLFAIQDVTEIEAAMNRQRIAAGVFEHSQDGLIVLDHNGVITMCNPALTHMLGYSSDTLVGRSFLQVFHWKQLQSLMPTIQESLSHYGQWQGEVWEKHLNGTLVPMFAKVSHIVKKVDQEEVYDMVIILEDLSDAKEMERLEYLAHHDALTGLANRSKLHRILEEELRSSAYSNKELALLYMDLDGFKQVNDTFGHDAGDEVLRVISTRLQQEVRSSDLVARLSGDEFVLLVKPASQQSVTQLTERLLQSICRPIEYKGQTLQVGCSIGVKLIGTNEKDMETILKSADTAMYRAKKAGKGQAIVIGAAASE